jgi:glycine C-acetyltransferase
MAQSTKIREHFSGQLDELRANSIYKDERVIHSPQAAEISVEFPHGSPRKAALNFCANNYLGLSDHPALLEAAQGALKEWGYGLSSVRFICGTQELHKRLEEQVSVFLGTEDTILYTSCFDANGGVFEALLGEEDAIISDELNHASIIDGIRLCKAHRYRYRNGDMQDLEQQLQAARSNRFRLIVTDGVFSMDGVLAKLDAIADLAGRYDALLMVDDSHATGFIGKTGRGTPEHFNVRDRVDIITTTFGKALGGASGGCVSGDRTLVDILRQRSRPYLFSNTLSPVVVAGTIKALELIGGSTALRDTLDSSARYFRGRMTEAGFEIPGGFHPIVPIMLRDAALTQRMARELYDEGIYVVGFFYPIVPKGKDRIRVQISAAHTRDHLDRAIGAFTKIGKQLGIIRI